MDATTAVAPPPTPNPEDKARYDAARKELVQALQKKRLVDRQLAQLEVQIYNFEGSYLSETAQHSGGNIIQGFDGYLKTQSVGRRRHEPTDADRVFSNSSLTYQKSLDILAEASDDPDAFGPGSLSLHPNGLTLNNHYHNAHSLTSHSHSHSHSHGHSSTTSRNPTPGLTSIVLPPPTSTTTTPKSHQDQHQGGSHQQQQLTAAQQKKMRDKEYQRRKRASAAREKERNAQLAAAAEAARVEAVRAQAAAVAAVATGAGVGRGSSLGIGEEGDGGAESISAAVSTARGRVTKKPRQADDD